MKIQHEGLTLFVATLCCLLPGALQASFILKKEVAASTVVCSKRSTKEKMGEATRGALFHCTALLAASGAQQAKLAERNLTAQELGGFMAAHGQLASALAGLQKKLLNLAQGLLDDHVVFRKSHAKHVELSLSCAQGIEQELAQRVTAPQPAAAMGVADEEKAIKEAAAKLVELEKRFAADRCLKRFC